MRQAFFLTALVLLAASAQIRGDEPKPIPIPVTEIWGYFLPRTHELTDATDNNNKYVSPEGKLVADIRHALYLKVSDQDAGSGFIVVGTGMEALRKAHAVLVDKQKPKRVFNTEDELTLVFFVQSSSIYVELVDVQRQGEVVQVRYRFEPHLEKISSEHFALIPLGKFPTGKFSVKMIQAPMKPKYADIQPITDQYIRRIICQSFFFAVKERVERRI